MAPGIIIYIVASMVVGFVGRRRRIGALGFFIGSLLLTPLVTLLILILSAPKKELPRHRAT